MKKVVGKLNKIANDIEDFAIALKEVRLFSSSEKIKLIAEELRNCIKELESNTQK